MSSSNQSLAQASHGVKQFCLDCLSGSFGNDRREAAEELGLRTFNSIPMLGWDLAFTKLLAGYPGAISTKNKSGCWNYALLYDPESDFMFSFMRKNRFKAICKMAAHERPIYVSALLQSMNSLTAPFLQQELFPHEDASLQRKRAIAERWRTICTQFENEGVREIKNHAFVVFSVDGGQISSLNANVVNSKMEVIEKDEWLSSLVLDIRPVVDDIAESAKISKPAMPLTGKAKERLNKEKLVKLKANSAQKNEG